MQIDANQADKYKALYRSKNAELTKILEFESLSKLLNCIVFYGKKNTINSLFLGKTLRLPSLLGKFRYGFHFRAEIEL